MFQGNCSWTHVKHTLILPAHFQERGIKCWHKRPAYLGPLTACDLYIVRVSKRATPSQLCFDRGSRGFTVGSQWKLIWDIYRIPSGNLTSWKITIVNGQINYNWQFSIAMLIYRRVFWKLLWIYRWDTSMGCSISPNSIEMEVDMDTFW